MTVIGSTRTPERLVPRLVHSPVAPQRVEDVSFWEYMTLDEVPDIRPPKWSSGIAEKTAQNYDRNLFQIYRELGYGLLDRATMHRLREAAARGEAAPVPQLPWETQAPEWQEILTWRDSKVKATLETQQKALVGLAYYWSQTGANMPVFLQTEWATEKAKNEARQNGDMDEYDLFLDDVPTDIAKLIGARPFESKLRATDRSITRRKLQDAHYKDRLGRFVCFQGPYLGPRGSEWTTLRLPMFQPKRGGIIGWPQPKKGMKPRDVVYPPKMDWLWTSKVDPSFTWYINNVRPDVYDPSKPTDYILLNANGDPWTIDGFRNFIREYIQLALDGEGRGPHSLRRACATWLYHHGWEVEEIALLLDDTPDVIRGSYIDWTWIKRSGRTNERSRSRRPPLPRIRSSGTTKARKPRISAETLGFDSATRVSLGKPSAPDGIRKVSRLKSGQQTPPWDGPADHSADKGGEPAADGSPSSIYTRLSQGSRSRARARCRAAARRIAFIHDASPRRRRAGSLHRGSARTNVPPPVRSCASLPHLALRPLGNGPVLEAIA